MGPYWKRVNLDKKEWIDANKLDSGLKLWEQLASDMPNKALVVLLAAMPEERGDGDLNYNPVIGRWAGDRIAFIGDYAEDSDLASEHQASTLYNRCRDGGYTDITDLVIPVLEQELGGRFEPTGLGNINTWIPAA